MNEFNFDSLKNIPVPEELIEKALDIPDSVKAAPQPRPVLKRRLMAAAGFVLVFAVSLSAYFLLGNISDSPIPVAPAHTEPADETEPATLPDDDLVSPTAPTEEPTEEPSADPGQTDHVAPTEAASERPTVKPTEKSTVKPTERPTKSPSQKPTQRPMQIPTQKPTQKPTQRPTEKPTQIPTQKPTEPPVVDPTEPEWPPIEEPTEAPSEPHVSPTSFPDEPGIPTRPDEPEPYIYFVPFCLDGREINGGLYCTFTDRNGNIIGAIDPYSPYKKAEYYIKGDWVYVSYERARVADLNAGYCYAKIYDRSGTVYLTQRVYL